MQSDKPKFVVLETSMGNISIELYWKEAPKTCKNFSELARRKYYDGVTFHRVIAVSNAIFLFLLSEFD